MDKSFILRARFFSLREINTVPVVVPKYFFNVHPETLGTIANLTCAYFSNGLERSVFFHGHEIISIFICLESQVPYFQGNSC